MTSVPLRPLMKVSVKHGFAQGAFSINVVTQAEVAIQIHEVFRSTAILQGADLANGFIGGGRDPVSTVLEDKKKGAKDITEAVKRYGEGSPVPIVLHLDHGRGPDPCATTMTGGYTSVMIDGSSLTFDENMELTREVVEYAYAGGVGMEGGLGMLAGVEGHMSSEGSTYTNPLKAVELFRETDVDALAISYGTMHGASKGKNVKSRKEMVAAIRECLDHEDIFRALVPHDPSAVPAYIVNEVNRLEGMPTGICRIAVGELQEATRYGINKINVDTDVRLAVIRSMRELPARNLEKRGDSPIGAIYEPLESKGEQSDLRVSLTSIVGTIIIGVISDKNAAAIADCIERGVKEVVGTLIVQFGSYDKAPLVGQVSLEEMTEHYKKMQI